ncbi:Tat pathway signal sequence domain protein [Labrys sp. WJW]|uniref:Tat pathway signal sequence domain protein n=1 Tax=Labrys sp. WJW TaxID=1737983 RepID=UPI0012EAF3A8|nr:Tat pathway signal sequence domain protein [Labrys sp. WJW]
MMKLSRFTAVLAVLVPVLAPLPALAADVSIDLNKLETQNGNCRLTMVLVNASAEAAQSLRADLVMFGADGVVAKRLAVDLAPIPASKTIVKAFDVAGLACEGIGSILLNDVPTCQFANGKAGAPSCLEAVSVSSKAGPKFFK